MMASVSFIEVIVPHQVPNINMSTIIDFHQQETTQQDAFIVKATQGTAAIQHRVPIFGSPPRDAPEDLLAAAQAFKRLADRLNWTDDECNNAFESCLSNSAASQWVDVKNAAAVGATFHDNLEEFVSACIPNSNACLVLQACVSRVRMTRAFTVQTFIARLQ